jgi:hypothetical protein
VKPVAAPPEPKAPAASAADGNLRDRMYTALLEAGLKFTADAIESSMVNEHAGEVEIIAPEELQLSLNEKEMQQFLTKLGVNKRIRLQFEAGVVAVPAAKPAAAAARDEAVAQRALEHPMVKRFQETFKDSQIRQVRDLKE